MTVVASNYVRKENDLYQTEPWATEALLRHVDVSGKTVWEPAAGNHLMADVLRESGATVVTSDIVTYDRRHDFIWDFLGDGSGQSATSKCLEASNRTGNLGGTPVGDRNPLRQGDEVSAGDGRSLRGDSVGILSRSETDGHQRKAEGEVWAGERAVQGRHTKHFLPQTDVEGKVQSVRVHSSASNSSSGRRAYEQRGEQSGGSLFSLPHQSPQAAMVGGAASCIVTNPPYGKGNRDAVKFAELALERCDGFVALLLTAKFDFGKTRRHLFRNNPRFYCKIALVDRIQWFPGDSSGTEDHAWYVWHPKDQPHFEPYMFWEGRVE